MAYLALSGLLLVIALLGVLLCGRLLLNTHWFWGWVRGMFGFALIVAIGILGLAALDLISYQEIQPRDNIATLSFNGREEGGYIVSVVDASGTEFQYELNGQLWQLDARIIRWSPTLAKLGMKPGYRLDRISGRYLSLEDERSNPPSVHGLANSRSRLDVWQWLHRYGRNLSLVQAQQGSGVYMPMVDGGLFSVQIGHDGLLATALNERAEQAVEQWQ